MIRYFKRFNFTELIFHDVLHFLAGILNLRFEANIFLHTDTKNVFLWIKFHYFVKNSEQNIKYTAFKDFFSRIFDSYGDVAIIREPMQITSFINVDLLRSGFEHSTIVRRSNPLFPWRGSNVMRSNEFKIYCYLLL